jgi:hypothetical protein
VTHVLDWISYIVLALLGWVGLVLVARAVIDWRTWAWARTQRTRVQLVCCVRRRHSGRSMVIPPPRDQPVAFMPRGGWM